MKTNPHLLAVLPLSALLLSACVAAWPDSSAQPTPPSASKADVDYLRGELSRLNARIQSLESEIGALQQNLLASRSAPASASQSEVAALRDQLSSLERQIRAVDDARAADAKSLYADLSKRVDQSMKSISASRPAPAPSKSVSQTGIEHVVQPGETLSIIAQAYGKKMADIMTANGLKSPDLIRIGQKLFIPD